ncbi:unnamed protein product [Colias eurytheme]|nr:unnamed protein product [Colias eurytheme]
MPYRRRCSVKMPDFDDDVTVVDVYDLASDIGKECEIIIEKYGPEAVTALLPKVINALELLENLAVRNEKENQALHELTAKISQLENDKIEKAEYRQRFEKEIEAIEEQWRTESAELVTAVARLQDENKRLRRTVNSPADGTSAPPSPAREHDQEVLSRLSSTAEKQRATLRHQELQLQEKQQLIDSLTNQVEKLAQVSRDLRRKHKQLQNQMRLVCEERTELSAIVQSQQRDIAALQQADAQNKKCASCGVAFEGTDDEDQSSKPTFSVRELRAILHERNELKLKLNRAEEQLQALQAEPQPDSGSDTSPSLGSVVADDEAPVQGPLPAEPDDAPWKRNSGIRKLFWLATWRAEGRRSPPPRISFGPCSLLSLISPWARSPGGRLAASYPRPPAPPPPPRRHSDPTRTDRQHAPPARRHSQLGPTDLRQELARNLDNRELDSWLGELDERLEHPPDPFDHDIPLQKSISLDRGLDIVSYLQTLGSDWSAGSSSSLWSLPSHGRSELRLEQYRSFEDIPASPKTKSRHVSLDVTNSMSTNSFALNVLRDSYKGIDVEMGEMKVSPQVKKLQKTFSFKSVDEFKASAKNSIENLDRNVNDDDDDLDMTLLVPSYRHISVSTSEGIERENRTTKQRRFGVTVNEWQKQKSSNDLRKELLIKQNLSHVKSYDDIFKHNKGNCSRRSSAEMKVSDFTPLKESYKKADQRSNVTSVRKRKVNFTPVPYRERRVVPTIVVEEYSSNNSIDRIAKIVTPPPNNSVETNIYCDCRICCENDDRKPDIFGNKLSRLFVKIVSYMDSARKLTCWDENNNLSENEMYTCIMHLLKLLFGLWLRHSDHN